MTMRDTLQTGLQNRLKLSPQVRGYIYTILTAAAPLAVGYGILTDEEVSLWLGLAFALLGLGTAAIFTPNNVPVTPEAAPKDQTIDLTQSPRFKQRD